MGRNITFEKQDEKKKAIRPVCIAGMHRSGTSMVAQLLHQCGLYLGNEEDILGPAPDNQDGFWENVRFVRINDEILRRFGGAWDLPPVLRDGWVREQAIAPLEEPAGRLIDTFRGHEPWGWKDPRNSLTSSFWEEKLGHGKIRYVVCIRNPLEVARSIYKRNFNSFAFSFNLWKVYHQAIITHTLPGQRVITHYEAYFNDPEQELKRILTFLGMNVSDEKIERACAKIARNLRHHSLSKGDLIEAGASRELVQLYEESCQQAGPVFLQTEPMETSVASKGSADSLSSISPPAQSSDRIRKNPDEVRKGLVSIVILTFNQLKYTRECIQSIQQYTPETHEIIFVDNGSTDGTVEWLRDLLLKNTQYHLLENSSNLGFARACNQGINAASGEYLLLLNNDVVATEHWLSGLLECLSSGSDIGIVGPMTNNISGIQKDISADYRSISDLQVYARTFREKNRHRRIPLRRIVGFCMLFRRELMERIGLLDESFGTGNFEDDDYCLRASLEGYRNMIAGDVFIHHYGSRTFIGNRIEYGSTITGHKKIFNEKWRLSVATDLGRKLLILRTLESAVELSQQGETGKAVERLLEGIQHAPECGKIYSTMARILFEGKRFKESLEALKSMPEPETDDRMTELLRGYCHDGLGLYEEAEVYADKVLALEPAQASALNLKGVVAYGRGDRKKAETFFMKAIESDLGYGEPHTNLGVIKWASGDKMGGLALLERGFVLTPQEVDIAASYHTATAEMKTFPRAEKVFGEAKALHPQNQNIAFLLIDLLLQQGKNEEAMAAIEEAMVPFKISDGLLSAALEVRGRVGAKEIKKGQKRKGTLSLSMIVKNEEQHIAKCLMSIRPVVDEMIVVDTGSKDRTKDIAKALGAKVSTITWTGDFSEARNHSLAKASGEWILSLDADEVISAKDHSTLKRLVQKSRPAAYKIVTRNYSTEVGAQGFNSNTGEYLLEEYGLGWFPSTKVRLFPNTRSIRFENPVHEYVERTARIAGLPIMSCSIAVHHYGRLNMAKVKDKGQAYYELGKKKLEKRGSNDLRAIYELGVQAGELKKYDEALGFFEKLVELEPKYPLALFNLGFTYMELGRFEEALRFSRRAYEMDPAKKECAVNLAHCELLVGDPVKAIALVKEALGRVPDYPPALGVLAAALAVTKKKIEGADIVEKLTVKRFDCTACLHEIAEGLSVSGRHAQALSVYELIVQTKQLQPDTRNLIEKCFREAGGGSYPPVKTVPLEMGISN